jgi:hypothetical protein
VFFTGDDNRQAMLGLEQILEGEPDAGHGFGFAKRWFVTEGGE